MEPTPITSPSDATQSVAPTPQATVAACLDQASQLQRTGNVSAAEAELEKALATARTTPYEIEFQTRIRLGMMLSDVYLSLDQMEKARAMLTAEVEFTQRVSGIMQATGTPSQKRAATSGYLQIRDRATQIGLIGQTAPEISIETWINGEPVLLEDLRGRVVLLEFWATWCKPCQEMFPKLKQLHQEAASSGLEIVAITRHYMAYGGTPESMQEELQLMQATVSQHGVSFRVGVATDEGLQATYGANGLPTAILIDRRGVVRYAGPGGEDRGFDTTLQQCLAESA
ncbi:MAG TPA: TlpA disulfide reductase family protein [Pyrinomonadaceae bacterium]|nr:TlpA disulfide reductase family protein [Pyrinomonadaceae bacterium]